MEDRIIYEHKDFTEVIPLNAFNHKIELRMVVVKDEWTKDKEGRVTRTIIEADLIDVSVK